MTTYRHCRYDIDNYVRHVDTRLCLSTRALHCIHNDITIMKPGGVLIWRHLNHIGIPIIKIRWKSHTWKCSLYIETGPSGHLSSLPTLALYPNGVWRNLQKMLIMKCNPEMYFCDGKHFVNGWTCPYPAPWICSKLSLTGVGNGLLVVGRWINPSPPSAAYMRQWIGSTLVQIMASGLYGTKPLSKPVLGYCQLGTNFSKFLIKIQIFSFMKMHQKILSAKWRPFCRGGDEVISGMDKGASI